MNRRADAHDASSTNALATAPPEASDSMNGTVTSTTRVLEDRAIVFLVNPSLYRSGPNELRVHRLA